MAIKLKNTENEEPKVYGNENFGIPEDCTKKQKFSTVKLIFYILAVVVICATGYKYYTDAMDKYLPEITYDKTSQPLIYRTNEGITVKTQRGKVSDVENSTEDIATTVKPAANGTVLFYLSNTDDLVMYDADSENTTVIDTGVTDYKINPDGRYVAYKKEAQLYLSDLKSTRLIHSNVSEYSLSSNNQVITFLATDGTALYTCSTASNGTPALVNMNIDKLVSPKSEYANIYYIKNNSLYSQKYNGAQTLISENVADAIMLGDTVYFTTEDVYERKLTDFFTDEMKETDELMTAPDGNDFISERNGLNFFDEDAFAEARNLYADKLLRDEIREYFEENPVTLSGYSLYAVDGEKTVLTDTSLVSATLSLNSCQSIIAYKKYDSKIAERTNLADITSLSEAISLRDESVTLALDDDMYLLREGKKPFFAFELSPSMRFEISLDEKYLYCIEFTEESPSGLLVKYEIGQSALKNRTLICDGATDFAMDGSDSSAVIVFCGESLSMYHNNTLTHLSDRSCREFFYVDDTLFYYDEYDATKKSGNLMSMRNEKITRLDSNVSAFKVRRYNNIVYIKDRNAKTGTGALCIKDGNRTRRIDYGVGAIIN